MEWMDTPRGLGRVGGHFAGRGLGGFGSQWKVLSALACAGSGSRLGAGAGSGAGVGSIKLSSALEVLVTDGFSLWIVCTAQG
jgi:hypothetical protein